MGNCCSGSGDQYTKAEPPPPDKKVELQNSAKRMSIESQERAQALFRQYRHRTSAIAYSPDGSLLDEHSFLPSAPSPVSLQTSSARPDNVRMPAMTQKDLQRLLHDVDPALFKFVWGLFDTSGDGFVYADDFVAAMALLTTSADANASSEEQMRACFVMFDTRGDGRLGCARSRLPIRLTTRHTHIYTRTPPARTSPGAVLAQMAAADFFFGPVALLPSIPHPALHACPARCAQLLRVPQHD